MTNTLLLIDESRRDEIDALRMQEYAKASGFAVELSTLRWKRSDSESFVLAAQRGDRLVSTMRGEFLEDRALLERKLECPWDFPLELRGPVLLLSRASTVSAERGSGLNLALRHWFLSFARHHGIRYVIGTFVSGSPRENSLRQMGYRFFENPLGWQQSTYRSLRPVVVAVLDLNSEGDQALNYCRSRSPRAFEEFPAPTIYPELRLVTCL